VSNRPPLSRAKRKQERPAESELSRGHSGEPHQGALLTLFFLSGVSGLVYETVWLRILTRVVGNTTYATSVVLAAFMTGMAVGSYFIGRYAAGVKNQLRLYAMLEFGVGITAVGLTAVLLHLAPFYQVFYGMFQESRFGLTVFQSVLAFGLMLVPTSLMGGTLPVLSAHTKAFHIDFAPRIGLLYGLNTLGAVLGVLGSGFITIGAWGETATFLTGAGITVIVAAMALALSAGARGASPAHAVPTRAAASTATISPYPTSTRRLVGFAYALSGFAAMSYEVIWTRMFQIQVGTSIYAFSIMLAFYLAGIGVGSLVGGRFLGALKFPLRAFAVAQLGIATYSILGLYFCTLFDPVSFESRLKFANVLVMPPLVVFPITVVLGTMFPLVCRCYVANEDDVSRAVGRLYALNTFGCIVGALVCGFLLIWIFGTRGTILALAAFNAAIGLAMLLREPGNISWPRLSAVAAGYLVIMAPLAYKGPDPFRVVINRALASVGRDTLSDDFRTDNMRVYYHKEGMTATVTALGDDKVATAKQLCINGISMTQLRIESKLMAHLPLLLHPHPKDVLVVCFGMGTTVRAVRVHKGVNCDVVELVPEVYECFKYLCPDAAEVLADPRIHHYADDGRNFLLVRPKKYDVITIDPAPPLWSAGTVNLYTKEFFELCQARLKNHGIVCLWIPPAGASEIRMIAKTFFLVFPNTHVWRSPMQPVIGLYMIGFKNADDPVQNSLRKTADDQAIFADLNEWGKAVPSMDALKVLHMMGPTELAPFIADAPVISDDHPYTEFPLWRSFYDPAYREKIIWRGN
jgi:spermidine synthase